ncbi:MAG: hypothetical protein P0Y60_04850 [Candidatus Microbacterium colombiense]|nr:MAG: hypothetical protein P0Y60_04850 [Microbacterium sp.]
MKTKHAATKIHPFRSSGTNSPGYSVPKQAVPQQPTTTPQRPSQARTLAEAADGMLAAAGRLHYRIPSFPDTRGSWLRVGAHQCRVPGNSVVTIKRASDGTPFGLVAGTVALDGQFWILVDRPEGVREVVGLPESYLGDLRRSAFGLSATDE